MALCLFLSPLFATYNIHTHVEIAYLRRYKLRACVALNVHKLAQGAACEVTARRSKADHQPRTASAREGRWARLRALQVARQASRRQAGTLNCNLYDHLLACMLLSTARYAQTKQSEHQRRLIKVTMPFECVVHLFNFLLPLTCLTMRATCCYHCSVCRPWRIGHSTSGPAAVLCTRA